MRFIKKIFKQIFNFYLKNEYRHQSFKRFNERPVEYAFALRMLSKFYPKSVLDVGSGTTAFPHLLSNCGMTVTAIDNIKDYWTGGMFNRHFYVLDDDILNPKKISRYDMVFCISTLEHIEDYEKAIINMVNSLNNEGILVLTFPSSSFEYIHNCYTLPNSSYGKGNPYIAQSFSSEIINSWITKYDLVEIESEFWKFWTDRYWTCGEQIIPPERSQKNGDFQIRCICLQKRSE